MNNRSRAVISTTLAKARRYLLLRTEDLRLWKEVKMQDKVY